MRGALYGACVKARGKWRRAQERGSCGCVRVSSSARVDHGACLLPPTTTQYVDAIIDFIVLYGVVCHTRIRSDVARRRFYAHQRRPCTRRPVCRLRCPRFRRLPYNLSHEVFLRRRTRSVPRHERRRRAGMERRRWGGRRASERGNGAWRVHAEHPPINPVINPNVNA